jgi:hypothetical protein
LKWGGLCPQIDIYGRKFNSQPCYGLKKIQFWKQFKSKGNIYKHICGGIKKNSMSIFSKEISTMALLHCTLILITTLS